jgi:hypothetical protein
MAPAPWRRIAFDLSELSDTICLKVWIGLPSERRAAISVDAFGCERVVCDPLTHGELVELQIVAGTGPRRSCTVAMHTSAYRLRNLEDGEEARPLAFRLASKIAQLPSKPRSPAERCWGAEHA